MGQSWWDCEDGVRGRVGGILKMVCASELVGMRRRCLGQSWWDCEEGVWGRVGGIVKMVCGTELVGL